MIIQIAADGVCLRTGTPLLRPRAIPYNRATLHRHVPNTLTALRLLLAIIFFALLAYYQYEGRGAWLLNIAFIIYIIALITDYLDGHLARKWKVEGAFGRITDPFVDKILVLGAFIFFAGKNFIIPETVHTDLGPRMVVKTITGVTPGIVVLLLARELLVTTLRGAAESEGHKFGADFAGKFKMGFQSGTILAILLYVNYYDWLHAQQLEYFARHIRNFGILATVAITLYSALGYIRRAVAIYSAR